MLIGLPLTVINACFQQQHSDEPHPTGPNEIQLRVAAYLRSSFKELASLYIVHMWHIVTVPVLLIGRRSKDVKGSQI